jgi:hypothetical protein
LAPETKPQGYSSSAVTIVQEYCLSLKSAMKLRIFFVEVELSAAFVRATISLYLSGRAMTKRALLSQDSREWRFFFTHINEVQGHHLFLTIRNLNWMKEDPAGGGVLGDGIVYADSRDLLEQHSVRGNGDAFCGTIRKRYQKKSGQDKKSFHHTLLQKARIISSSSSSFESAPVSPGGVPFPLGLVPSVEFGTF